MDSVSIIYISLEAIIGVCAILGNSLVLIAIYTTKNLQNVTNVFIASLALADLMVGIIVAPLAAMSYLGLPRDYMACVFSNSVVVMFTQVSIFNLVVVGFERYLAINHPFFYQRTMTVKSALVMVVLTWIAATLVGLVPVFGWNLGPTPDNICSFVGVIDLKYMVYFNFFGFVLTPLVIMLILYTIIFYIVRKQMAKIVALEIVSDPGQRSKRRQFMSEVKAAKSLSIIIFVFALCWLPIHVLNCLSLFCGGSCFYPNILLTAILLSHANSSVNPFLYAIGNSKFQAAFKKMLCSRLSPAVGSHSSDDETTNHRTTHKITQSSHSNSGFKNSNISMISNGKMLGHGNNLSNS